MTPETVEEIEKEVFKTIDFNNKLFPLQFGKNVEKQGIILLNHFQNFETLKSLVILAKNKKAGDIAILSRSIFESSLNMGLLLHLPLNEGLERYRKYTSVESLKIYQHMTSFDKETADKIYKSLNISECEREANEYRKKYGKPKNSWSGLSCIEICKILDKDYPPVIKTNHFFEFMYCQVYRYSSSIIHRTQMGLLRNIKISSKKLANEKCIHFMDSRKEGLIFNYFHGLISFIISIRILGRAFNISLLENYFQKRIGFLIAGYKND
jgi:hypothetical protein